MPHDPSDYDAEAVRQRMNLETLRSRTKPPSRDPGDSSCPGCGAKVDEEHKGDCPEWLAMINRPEPTKPDWGHGPNPPVRMFTEEQIRTVMEEHQPLASHGLYCKCAWRMLRGGRIRHMTEGPKFTIDHLIDKLKEANP